MYNTQEAINFLEYNAERPHLIIPEYGRHLQKLIDQAVALPTKEERNKAARYIIGVMGSLNPHLRDVPDFQHKLWDQIFIMSDFKLDVDSPYPTPSPDTIALKPSPLGYPQNFPKYRFYGNNIKFMIDVANSWEDGELKNALIIVIANHMKKSFLSWNKDTVKDDVIFEHLKELSGGRINLQSTDEELSNATDLMKVNKKLSNKSQFGSSNTNPKLKMQRSNANNGRNNNQNNNNNRKP